MRIAFSLVYDKPQVIVMSYMHMVSLKFPFFDGVNILQYQYVR